jgi:hypothetical protein
MPDTLTVEINQGYPQNIVQRPDDLGWEYDLQLYVAAPFETALASFPAIGDVELGWGLVDSAKVLTRRFSSHPAHNEWTICDLHCGTPSTQWVAVLEDGGLQKPLEFHPSYLMKWNYHLSMKKGTSSYASYGTATTPELSEANAALMKWVKEPSEAPIDPAPDGPWKVLTGFAKTKPGVDAYIYPSPVVRESFRWCTVADAWANALEYTVGTVYNSTAQITLTGYKWLVMSSGYTFDGAYAITQVTYQGASSWDSDLYGSPQDQP